MNSKVVSVKYFDNFGRATTFPAFATSAWLSGYVKYALFGLFILLVNFPAIVRRYIETRISDESIRSLCLAPLDFVQFSLSAVIGDDPADFLRRTLTITFVLIWIWLIVSIAVSLRQRNARWIGYALSGLVIGFFTLHFLSWVAVIIVSIFTALIYAVQWTGSVFTVAFHLAWTHSFILMILVSLATAIALRSRLLGIWNGILSAVKKYWKTGSLILGALIVLTLVVPVFWNWVVLPIWNWVISPIFSAVGWLLSWLLSILFVLLLIVLLVLLIPLALAFLGSLFVAQLQAGWHAGKNEQLALVAGFAIGSLLTLIFLVSMFAPNAVTSLDLAWSGSFLISDAAATSSIPVQLFNFFMPEIISDFSSQYLINLQAPAFDSLVLLAMLILAVISISEKLLKPRGAPEPSVPVLFVVSEYGKMVAGLLVGLLLIFAQGIPQDGG